MRQVIDNFISNDNDSILLIADLGKFPKSTQCNKCINVGLSETLLVNTAIGLALTGLHVYVYSAANFVLYRAFEQIKLHVIENSNRKNNKINITFLNGGSGFCYAGYGIGHYLLDDIHLILTQFSNINCYFPYDEYSTIKALKKSKNGINYVRLCLDSQCKKIKIQKNNNLTIATFGWLVEKIQNICYKENIQVNIIPIFQLKQLYKILAPYIIIYDNIFINTFAKTNCIKSYYINKKYECFGKNIDETLKTYKFDDNSLKKYIKQYVEK